MNLKKNKLEKIIGKEIKLFTLNGWNQKGIIYKPNSENFELLFRITNYCIGSVLISNNIKKIGFSTYYIPKQPFIHFHQDYRNKLFNKTNSVEMSYVFRSNFLEKYDV